MNNSVFIVKLINLGLLEVKEVTKVTEVKKVATKK